VKVKFLGWLIAIIIRAVGLTLRWRIKDCSGVTDRHFSGSVIIAIWHNQIFGGLLFYTKFLGSRHTAVLTSASGDGDLLAAVMGHFGAEAIRGSSNKRPVAALREMVSFLRESRGKDLCITPDGPRGPVYKLESGLIKVSQWTGVPILPMKISYSNAISLKTWDRFRVPLPFSRVDVTLEKLESFSELPDRQSVEEKRASLEKVLVTDA
jgi:hypothetical protein